MITSPTPAGAAAGRAAARGAAHLSTAHLSTAHLVTAVPSTASLGTADCSTANEWIVEWRVRHKLDIAQRTQFVLRLVSIQ